MNKLTIHRQYFVNSDCYKTGTIQIPKGIQVHSTGANNPYLKRYVQPDDGLLGINKYNNSHNRSDITVCASAYIGKLDNDEIAVYQALPWDYRCWLSGSGSKGNANKLGYIGYEICEDNLKDKKYFEEVIKTSILLNTYLCMKYNIPVTMIHDHKELHDMDIASNHHDIKHWIEKYNLTMDDYRKLVEDALKEELQVTYIEGDKIWIEFYGHKEEEEKQVILYEATVTAEKGNTVNLRAQTSTDTDILARVPLNTTIKVVEEVNEEWVKIEYNDIIGYMMRKFLIKKEPEIIVSREELTNIKNALSEAISIIDSLL